MPPESAPADRVAVGSVADLSDQRSTVVADGRAVVIRVGDRVVAYQSHCLHQRSPLGGGLVMDGCLICPHHFWRYRVDDGSLVGGDEATLERFDVEIVDGEAFVLLPQEPPERPIREQLLDRARDYDRRVEFERRSGRPSD